MSFPDKIRIKENAGDRGLVPDCCIEKVEEAEKRLWQQMADLTLKKCKQKCKIPGSCCSREYCEIAENMAISHGIKLNSGSGKLPFLDETGKCIVPPYLRPMCSLHQCEIANIGEDIDDPEWTEQYFKLRAHLDEIGYDQASGMW